MTDKYILLVEDNADDEELTRIAFRESHLVNELQIAHDGQQALDLLIGGDDGDGRPPRGLPGLILLDLQLPKIDGLEVLRRLRAHPRTQDVPVVVLTSSREESDLAASYASGCNSYVRKPVNFAEFVNAARQIGLYWLLLNETPRR